MADLQKKPSTKASAPQNNRNIQPTSSGNHRRVYTEGTHSKDLGEFGKGNQGLKNEGVLFMDEEEVGSAEDDGVPIYSNSGVSHLLDHKQIQQMLMNDPAQLQALFGKDVDYQQLYGELLQNCYQRGQKEPLFVVGDEDDDDFDYIDINSLPNDQQQYFLQMEGCSDDGNKDNELEGYNVQFYENLDEIEDEQRELSNYGEDLADLYENDEDNVDLIKYQGIHLMNRQYEDGEEDLDDQEERYSCPETGSHFEFLEMCRRLKKLQSKRKIVDKALEEEEARRDHVLQMRKEEGDNYQEGLEQQALGQEGGKDKLRQDMEAQLLEAAYIQKAKEDLKNKVEVIPEPPSQLKDNKPASEVITSHEEGEKELRLLEQIQKKGYSQAQQEDYVKQKQVKAQPLNQALPTENILMTEEGNGMSLNFYGGVKSSTTDKKQGLNSKKMIEMSNKNAYLVTQEDDISEFISNKKPKDSVAGVINLQQLLKENDIINKKNVPNQNQLHCLTEINEKYSSREKKNPTFTGTKQGPSTRFRVQMDEKPAKLNQNMDVFSFNKELIQKQLRQKEQELNLNPKKKKQSSRSNSKKRQSSTQDSKQTQFQKLLLSFTKNDSTKSRASNDKSVYGGTKVNRGADRLNNQVFSGGPNIMINNGVVINQQKNQNTNQIYSSIGMLNKPKNLGPQNNHIQKRKNNGLLPRGNTIDNRGVMQNSTTNNTTIGQNLQGSAQAAASHSTTVGLTSYNGSRPDSAIKKKLGLSPQAMSSMPKFNYHQKKPSHHMVAPVQPSEFKNFGSNQSKGLTIEERKGKIINHKKVNSMNFKNVQITKSGSNYSKGMQGLLGGRNNKDPISKINPTLDQNSLALEQILNSQLDVVGPVDSQYQTFNDLINNTVVTQTHCSSKGTAFINKGSGSKQTTSQKYRAKSNYKPNSRQKPKQELNLQSNDPMHMEMETLLKHINLQPDPQKKRTSGIVSSNTNKNQSKTYLPSQYSSITNGLSNQINFPTNSHKSQLNQKQMGDPTKRYNSTKQSSREPTQKTRSKESRSSRLSGFGTKVKSMNVAVQPFHVKPKARPNVGGGSSYDFRGERCETVS